MPDHEPDTQGYERAGGTDAGTYYMVEPGILLAVPRPGYRQTVDGARASLAELQRISRERGRPMVALILIDRVRDQDRGSRRVWTDETEPSHMLGLGLIGATPLARAIGSFFMGLTRPKVPTRLLSSFEEGIEWARQLQDGSDDAGDHS